MLRDPANPMKVLPQVVEAKIKTLKALIIVSNIFKKIESLGHQEKEAKHRLFKDHLRSLEPV